MVLKLCGFSISTATRRVAVILKEKEVPFELIKIDFLKMQHKSAEYLQYQPFGQVPYIVSIWGRIPYLLFHAKCCSQDDDGFILYESRAICRYIEAKYPNQGTSLIPTDPKANALFEQAASVESFNFDPKASELTAEVLYKQ
jgi:glutathione S-transferase